MYPRPTKINCTVCRRDLGALAIGAGVLLMTTSVWAQDILRGLRGDMDRWRKELEGDLTALKEDAREEVAYVLGMLSYVYGYPMVVMDVTRQVLTAAPEPNSEGTAAPINQLAKMPRYVSLDSLWTTDWLDLEQEPIVLSVPDTNDRVLRFLDPEYVDRYLCFHRQAQHWNRSRRLAHRRAKVARQGTRWHQADLSLLDSLCVGARADASKRP